MPSPRQLLSEATGLFQRHTVTESGGPPDFEDVVMGYRVLCTDHRAALRWLAQVREVLAAEPAPPAPGSA